MDRSDPLPDQIQPDEMVVVGRVQGPYGVRGWVRVMAYTDPPANLADYLPWLVATRLRDGARAKGSADSGSPARWRPLEVQELRPHKQGFVVRFEGSHDRDTALGLQGLEIGVRASVLPGADSDEYYWRDLTGMEVRDQTGTAIGRVESLIQTGAHDVLVINDRSQRREDVLIPFHRNFVLDVDRATRVILVDWQIG